MPTHSQGIVNAGDPPSPPLPRRRFVGALLGSGFLATAVAFLYPVLRYLVPPKASDVGGDAVIAGRVGELKPNSGKIFRFGSRPGLLILSKRRQLQRASPPPAPTWAAPCSIAAMWRKLWCPCHNGIYGMEDRREHLRPAAKAASSVPMFICAAMRLSSPTSGRAERESGPLSIELA